MKRTSLKRKSKTPLAIAKTKLWKTLKQILEVRDGDVCISCGATGITGHNKHGGHFLPSASCGGFLRYDLRNVHSQCLTAESNVLLADGTYKSIKDIVAGDKLSAFNDVTLLPEEAVVLEESSFMPEKLFKVEMENGDVFFATSDHQVVTDSGWKRIDEITTNESIQEYESI